MKTFQEFINESKDYVTIGSYDFKSLFDKINKECFYGKLELIPILVKPLKNATGRFHTKYNKQTKELKDENITISNFFHLTEEEMKNLMCHEMIHYYISKVLKDPEHSHGDKFQKELARVNKLGYNVTLRDDVAKHVNYDEIEDLKKPVGILLANTNVEKEVVYIILPNVDSIDWEEVSDVSAKNKLKNIKIYFTKSPVIKKLTTPRTYKVMALKSKYYYLYKEIAEHSSSEDKTTFFETFFE